MPLPSREEQFRRAVEHLERDGLVIIKDRAGNVAADVEAWAAGRGIATVRRARTLGRASHWEIRRA